MSDLTKSVPVVHPADIGSLGAIAIGWMHVLPTILNIVATLLACLWYARQLWFTRRK